MSYLDISNLSIDSIPTLAMGMSQINTMSQVGTAVLSAQLDTASSLGSEMTKMMELSVNPEIGSNFDMSV